MKKAIVIFGSTGNLMYKKLIPAIHQLFHKGHLDDDFKIYAIARRDQTKKEYIEHAQTQVKSFIDWDNIDSHLEYVLFDVNDINDYKNIKTRMRDDGYEDVTVYLAVPPKLFPIIAKNSSESGLIHKGDMKKRIVFEKPFGEDLSSARYINRELWKYFDENQIYRIDHYLGKEMIQNILVVRFANIIFDQTWNHHAIKSITIMAKEEEGVMSRGGYYDKVGALKDMLQSHLLQMAALVLMDKPSVFNSEEIKNKKMLIFEHMNFKASDLILGQYSGYRDSEKVSKDSHTETFVYAKATIDDPRWQGVPIHFITGKKLNEKRSEIIIHFKQGTDFGDFFPKLNRQEDRLVIKVAPQEGVEFEFSVKEPGLTNNIHSAHLDYCHNCNALENTPEAYERLLLEIFNRQQTLFTRWDEIEKTWALVDHLKPQCNLYEYKTYDDICQLLKKKGVNVYDL
jgi:glucose-6-phosphate 1-dehydrogenase